MMNSGEPFYVGDVINAKRKDPNLRKSERTRLKLMSSAASELMRLTFKQLRIDDVSTNAGVSRSLAYHYFNDKSEIVSAVVGEYVSEFTKRRPIPGAYSDPYHRVLAGNYYYIGTHFMNAGVMQVLTSHDEDFPNMLASYNKVALDWHERISHSLSDSFCGKLLADDEKLLIACSLGGMADEILRQINILGHRKLKRFARKSELINLSEILSLLWYRSIYGKNPSKKSIAAARNLVTQIES